MTFFSKIIGSSAFLWLASQSLFRKDRTVLIRWKIRHGKPLVNHFKTYGRFEVKGKYYMARKTIECANMWFCNSNSTFSVYNFSQVLFGGLICGERRGLIRDINEHQEQRTKKSLIFFIKTLFTSNMFTKAYSESCQISKMETLCENGQQLKAVNCFCKTTPSWMFDRTRNIPPLY